MASLKREKVNARRDSSRDNIDTPSVECRQFEKEGEGEGEKEKKTSKTFGER